ncbi:MAG: UDP-N-acetylglucosamine 2-epimerase (non-hydrolyzing) [Patescibacteria group bacterium]
MKHVALLAGTRPNFMKIAPLQKALVAHGVTVTLIHTGQHYDANMSDVFFQELQIPAPDVHLGVGPGDRVVQTKKIVEGLLPVLREREVSAIVVVGDVTSTAAGAMAGVIAGVPVIHVEAGLRSFNWRMPEELNRMIADHHSAQLFVTEASGLTHLKSEHIPDERVHFVGNVMIDCLRSVEPLSDRSTVLAELGLSPKRYGVVTLHRPENVDDPIVLSQLWSALCQVSERLPLVFPVHPRTKQRFADLQQEHASAIKLIDPVGYIEMVALMKQATCILTDSGGLQEEATALGVPCLTMRTETERPSTIEIGTNEMVGLDPARILDGVDRVLKGEWKKGALPPLWDGHAAERIADMIAKL